MTYLNVASYKFITLESASLPLLQKQLKAEAVKQAVKGSILLSTEGINLFLAGEAEGMQEYMQFIKIFSEFSDLCFKLSNSAEIPFQRLRVRIKKEIIAMKQDHIHPEQHTAPYLDPTQLRQWYEEGRDMMILDTRNSYEYKIGTFDQAVHLNIENFNEFPAAVAVLADALKTKSVVTFCTGGIRCEKAAAYLQEQGFTEVWQLKGGILNYFEVCGSANFQGNCFVFDERGAVDSTLKPVI